MLIIQICQSVERERNIKIEVLQYDFAIAHLLLYNKTYPIKKYILKFANWVHLYYKIYHKI